MRTQAILASCAGLLITVACGRSAESYSALSAAAELLPSRPDVKVALADLLLPAYLGDKRRPVRYYNELTKLSRDLLAHNPNSYDGLRIKGNLVWSDGKLKEAAGNFAKAGAVKSMQPDLIPVWVYVLFLDGQDVEGERLALKFLKTHKDSGKIYDVLFQHYNSNRRPIDAENILKAKVNNNPREIDYALQLGSFYALAGKNEQMAAILRPLENPDAVPQGALKVGDFYRSRQDWAEALRQYDRGARANPKDRITYLKRIADVWLQHGKGEQAAGYVREILRQQPKDESARAINASLQLKAGRRDQIDSAVQELQALVTASPDNAIWRFSLGRALIARGDLDAARSQFQEAVKRRPNLLPPRLALAEVSRLKQDYGETLRISNEILALQPNLPTARLLRAVGFIGTRQHAQARSELGDMEKRYPQEKQVQFQLAVLEVDEKKFPAAEARLQRLYADGNGDPGALAGLVEAYRAGGHADKALAFLNAELRKSEAASTRALLADTALRAGQYDLAIEQYQLLKSKGMRSPHLEERLGTALELKGNFGGAVASFERARQLAPSDPAIELALADALRIAGHKQEAIAAYREVLKLEAENTRATNHLAYLLVDEDGKTDEAQSLAQEAFQKEPKNPEYEDTLGLVYLKKNLGADAVQIFRNLAQRYPANPLFHYHYGLALMASGQEARAKVELQTALPMKPSADVRKGIESTLAKLR